MILLDSRRGGLSACALLTLSLLACSAPSNRSESPSIRLVDLVDPSAVQGKAVVPASKIARTEWRFDGDAPKGPDSAAAATRGFKAEAGVKEFAVRGGRLAGTTTTDFPVIHVERTSGLQDHDLLHAVEVRLKVSRPGKLTMAFLRDEKIDVAKEIEKEKGRRWRMSASVAAGDEVRTIVLRNPFSPDSSDIRHILIRPVDASGVAFEIESLRLIFRKEYLEGIPSGVSWQGLSEIYHETIVSRLPEKVSLDVTLPAQPWLDLSLGTVESGPVTFRLSLAPSGSAGPGTTVLERTVSTPYRWETAPIDLAARAGEKVRLTFELSGAADGAIGFWGSPVVRSRGARPMVTASLAGSAPPRHVILVWADTLRRDHLDMYGYARATAPHIRQLAAEGALFKDCIGQATWTKVATPSLLTGLYPTTHGVHDFYDRIPASATTIAEVYRDAGYATLSFSSILFTGKFTNLHQGFEELHEDGSLPDRESSKTSRVYVDRLLPWLEAHRDVPSFVFLHVSDPHDPYRPYPPYDATWADPSKREAHEKAQETARKFIADPLMKNFGMPSRTELAKAGLDPDAYVAEDRDWYDGSIRGMDAEIGRLMERLRALGLDRDTLVVFTGDHGEEFLEHGRTFHGQTTYGELSNVSLAMWEPGVIPAGTSIPDTVETVDIMPTILALSGLEPPKEVQGTSFLPLLKGTARKPAAAGVALAADAVDGGWSDRPAITERAATTEIGGAPPPMDESSLAITLAGWKMIHNIQRPAGKPEFELFDEKRDPLNLADVADAHPEIVERLSKTLAAWKAKVEAEKLKPDADSSKAMTPEEIERLRSLGYIQ
ncbi:MAG: sulfatase [Acidobacteria bacterium]|nr:sulfatase [Acidobacteriota bacterium]